jgi:alcohol dehydrogenase class IV
VVSGKACLETLHRFLSRERIQSLVIVTGPHVSKLPEFGILREACAQAGRSVAVFDRTTADPSFEVVRSAASFARDFGAQAVVGVGGGSPLDTAKVVAALLTNDVDVAELVGPDRVENDPVPLVAVPTTAGTGSEVTNVSILTDVEANLKKAVLSDLLVPRLALLWPELTLGLPASTTAATGMDALCHAAEAVLSLKRNPASDALAYGALSRIGQHLPRVIADPGDLASREAMMEASLMAGLAFNNSSVTAVHAFAYPLGGRFHMAHGLANSLMFGPVMRHGQSSEPDRYAELARAFAGIPDALAFVPSVERMRRGLPLPSCLREAGIPEDALDPMSDDVLTIERLLSVNPRSITRADAGRIYREAWEGVPA